MLLPALSSAREMGRRAACVNNLKQFGIAAAGYGTDWDGFICGGMPMNVGDRRGEITWTDRDISGPTGPMPIYHGAYYSGGYLNASGVYFCPSPSIDRGTGGNADTHMGLESASWMSSAWKAGTTNPTPTTGWCYSGYTFNTAFANFGYPTGSQPWRTPTQNSLDKGMFTKMWKFGQANADWPLMMDTRSGGAISDWVYSAHKATGFNVLKIGGHVKWTQFKLPVDPSSDPNSNTWAGAYDTSLTEHEIWTLMIEK